MSDLIDRQAAIDAVKSRKTAEQSSAGIMRNAVVDFCVDIIKKLPSAQPDIVRCRDCRYYNAEEKECLDLLGHGRRWEDDDFCSYAERREVTT